MTTTSNSVLTPEQNARATALQIAKPLLTNSTFLSTGGVASSDLGSLITLADYIIDGHPPLMLMDADGRRGIVLTQPDDEDEKVDTLVEDLTDPAVEPDRTVIQPQFNPDNTDTAPTLAVPEPNVVIENNTFTGADEEDDLLPDLDATDEHGIPRG